MNRRGFIRLSVGGVGLSLFAGCEKKGPQVEVEEHVTADGTVYESFTFSYNSGEGTTYFDAQFKEKGSRYYDTQITGVSKTRGGRLLDFAENLSLTAVNIWGGKITAESQDGTEYHFDVKPQTTNRIDNRMDIRGGVTPSSRNLPPRQLSVPNELKRDLSTLLRNQGYHN